MELVKSTHFRAGLLFVLERNYLIAQGCFLQTQPEKWLQLIAFRALHPLHTWQEYAGTFRASSSNCLCLLFYMLTYHFLIDLYEFSAITTGTLDLSLNITCFYPSLLFINFDVTSCEVCLSYHPWISCHTQKSLPYYDININ